MSVVMCIFVHTTDMHLVLKTTKAPFNMFIHFICFILFLFVLFYCFQCFILMCNKFISAMDLR